MIRLWTVVLPFFVVLLAQASSNNFYISNHFFQGEKVLFFSESRGGGVVVLEGNKIYLMNKKMEFNEVTKDFGSGIIDDLICVESIDEYRFLLGTASHSLLMYDAGNVVNLKELNPHLPSRINSLDFDGRTHDFQVLVATNENLFVSRDLKTYTSSPIAYTDSTVFYGSRSIILLTDYDRCNNDPLKLGLQLSAPTYTSLFEIFQNDTLKFEKLNDVQVAKAGYGSNSYNSYTLYATENGVYAQDIYSCSKYRISHFKNTEVHDFEFVNAGLTKPTIFLGSDKGLLYLETDAYGYFNVHKPTYSQFDGIDSAYLIKYSRYHNNIWVGTNSGLILLNESKLTRESFQVNVVEYDTIDLCKEEGTYLRVDINDQWEINWYKNNQLIEGAISTTLRTYEPGEYSLQYRNDSGETKKIEVAKVRLDSTFIENIAPDEYLICPDDFNLALYIENFNSYHHYRWYSIERGLEFDAGVNKHYFFSTDLEGHYYFTATNCNDFIFNSDTVYVIKSGLAQPYFDETISDSNLCIGDTVFLQGTDNAIGFKWYVDFALQTDHNKPYLVVPESLYEDHVKVITSDELGCIQEASIRLPYVLPLPRIEPHELIYQICDTTGYVYLYTTFLSTPVWEGNSAEGVQFPISAGVYPVILTNGACPDFLDTVTVYEYDPLPMPKSDLYVKFGDTLTIPFYDNFPMYWSPPLKYDWVNNNLFITADSAEVFNVFIEFLASTCVKRYTFNVHFVKDLLVHPEVVEFQIFPNPASENITIQTPGIVRVELMDLFGATIAFSSTGDDARRVLTLPLDVQEGLYLIRVSKKDGKHLTRKILIEK